MSDIRTHVRVLNMVWRFLYGSERMTGDIPAASAPMSKEDKEDICTIKQ